MGSSVVVKLSFFSPLTETETSTGCREWVNTDLAAKIKARKVWITDSKIFVIETWSDFALRGIKEAFLFCFLLKTSLTENKVQKWQVQIRVFF